MEEKKPLLGLCPIGKFVFSNEDAVHYKKRLQAVLKGWNVSYVDLEGVLEDGLVKDQKQVEKTVAHFQQAGIDCLFIPHCNFGTEGAAAMVARKLDVPTLLWGPRDEAPLPDGTRLRDSLCGLFATSKVLNKLNVPFTYIENCRIEDDAFQKGLDTFLRATHVANAFRKGIRIGHIGQRIDFFWCTIVNESELLQKFNVEVLPLDMVEFIAAANDRAALGRAGYEKEVKKLRNDYAVEGFDDDLPLVNVLAVRDQILALAGEHGLDGVTHKSFMSLVNAMNAYPTYAACEVTEQYPLEGESDIHGIISEILLQRVNFNISPSYLAEFTIRHPDNDNGVLLWHFGAPLSLCHPDEKVSIAHHWILPSSLSGMPHFQLKDGPITVARFDGERGEYQLAVGQGHSIEGPKTLNNYVWMEVDDWPHWERTLIEGPFIHHVSMIYGHYGHVLLEACKYIPALQAIKLNH
jgi:L-fucose isomerase-like protein